jgi:ATP-binding cassette subfamily B (MDR/TAP) protein 1
MVRAAVGDRMSTILQNLALVITAFCIAFYLQWRVAAVILGTFPLLISAAVGEVCSLRSILCKLEFKCP